MFPLRIRSGHKGRGYISSTAVAVLALLLLVQPGGAHAAPQELVSSGVSGVVRDTPNGVDSTFFWTTVPTCSNAPGDELQPMIIYRGGLSVWRPREIFSFNPPRAVGICNPYRLLSDVVADADFVYFIDNQGPNGHSAIWRRDRRANAADPSQLIGDLGDTITGGELLVFDHYVFAILHRSNTFDVIVEYDKTGVLLNGFVELAGPDELSNMQFDGRYLYWISAGKLRRNDTTNGAKVTSVNGPISTYYLEGYDQQCNPKVCEEYSRVLFAQGNQLFEIDTVGGGGAQPQYTSATANAQIIAITRDAIHYFFIERRPVGGGFDREDRFYRLGVGSTVPALIYGPVNNGGPGFDGFTTDYTWLYFHDRVAHTLLRLANDAAAIPIYDVAAYYMEVTQGLQNYDNALRLIEGKRTIVRAFARATGVDQGDVSGVTASLQGYNQQGYLGTVDPVNAGGKLITVRRNPQRTELGHSFQFELPRHWTTGGNLSLTATINPFGRVVEDVTNNNSTTLSPIAFAPSRRLHVGYLNFRYVLNGTSYDVPIDEVLASQRRMRHLYPIADPVGAFAGVGLRITSGAIWDFDLGPQVARTAQDCIDRYKKVEDRNMCASDRVQAQIAMMRRDGLIHEETVSYGNIPQAPDPAPGVSYFTRGYANGRIGSGPSTDPNYAPHEIGHVLGRSHPTQGSSKCGHSASDDNYPYFLGVVDDDSNRQTRYAGLDFDDRLPGGMTFIEAGSTYDTMSYCSPNWISDYTYDGIYNFLLNDPFGGAQGGAAQGAQVAIPGDWLIVTGTLDPPTRTGGFTMVQRTDSIMDATPPVAGGFTLELRDSDGQLLASHGFTATPIGEQPDRVAFDVAVAFVPGTTQLRAIEDATGRTLATRNVSTNAPLISDVRLVDAPSPVDAPLPVTWTASDRDGDALRFDVLASRDGGVTYRPIQLGIDGDSVELDTSLLGGGTNTIRIVAHDGVQTAHAESAPFTVTPRPPVAMITSPVDGFHADWGQLIAFEVEIQDLQDEAIADAQITWSNGYGVLGTGRMLQTDTLEVGTNLVEVTVTNSLGASGSASVTVIVGDRLIPLGPTLSVAPQTIAWHIANAETPAQVAQIEVENAGAGSLDFDVSSSAPWLRIDSALGVTDASAPRTFILTADPTLAPAGTTSHATLTFESHADANDVVVVPVSLSRGNVFDHTGAEAPCPGDCDTSGDVKVDELVRGVNIALDRAAVTLCPVFDSDSNRRVTVSELVAAVNAALGGC